MKVPVRLSRQQVKRVLVVHGKNGCDRRAAGATSSSFRSCSCSCGISPEVAANEVNGREQMRAFGPAALQQTRHEPFLLKTVNLADIADWNHRAGGAASAASARAMAMPRGLRQVQASHAHAILGTLAVQQLVRQGSGIALQVTGASPCKALQRDKRQVQRSDADAFPTPAAAATASCSLYCVRGRPSGGGGGGGGGR